MKKLSVVLSMLCLSSFANANSVELVNGDGSPASQFCVDAVYSGYTQSDLTEKLRLTAFAAKNFTCNGYSVDEFVHLHQSKVTAENVKVFAFESSDGKFATDLCIAAATSNRKWKSLLGSDTLKQKRIANKLYCNGMPAVSYTHLTLPTILRV